MGVPDEVEVVTRNEKHVGRDALQMEELLIARHGVLEELVAAIMRQRHLHAFVRDVYSGVYLYFLTRGGAYGRSVGG